MYFGEACIPARLALCWGMLLTLVSVLALSVLVTLLVSACEVRLRFNGNLANSRSCLCHSTAAFDPCVKHLDAAVLARLYGPKAGALLLAWLNGACAANGSSARCNDIGDSGGHSVWG
jgi:hypothetical protein